MNHAREVEEALKVMRASISEWNKAARRVLRDGSVHDMTELEDALEFARDLATHHQQAIEGDRRRGQHEAGRRE